MYLKSLKGLVAGFVVVAYIFLLAGIGYAEGPTVKLIVNPNRTDVSVGSDPTALTAKASGSGLQFTWKLQGPGKIEGSGSAIFYHIPEEIEGESAQAMITITVTDDAGQETTETFTFNILAPQTSAAATPAAPVEEGMSMTTKVAIGVGAAALVGGGIALAAGGGDDEKSGPFSGKFTREYVSSNTGAFITITLDLKQDGNSVSGSRVSTGIDYDCCTAVYTVAVIGTANENSAVLSWGLGSGRCEGSGGCWYEMWTDGGSFDVELLSNNNILRFLAWNSDYLRSSKMLPQELEMMEGDFIRQ